ncbi:BON domain-containing protein [Geomonas sp. Red32]|uniref:BON domain-containing protein n=1 Tax=Geomonas sp. Red32 TaxID=2912856 RepID=UPI00202CE026|nr:BON domain-containing protein [Geomonas sp. Red32]MCM0081572.1 BON domain-containing protein [Geomonas sp. Red32]
MIGCATTSTHESTGQYVDDSVVTTKVKAALFDELSLKTFNIGVKTYQGVVQLSGFVDTLDQKTRAGDVASRVSGVTDVKNDLIVK